MKRLYKMGNGNSTNMRSYIVNFDNVNQIIMSGHTIIHVMSPDQETYLIKNTLSANKEIDVINQFIEQKEFNKTILIYGKNMGDYNVILQRHNQMRNLGFTQVYMYLGGLFEWLLLQELYGAVNFPTSVPFKDNLLDYKIPQNDFV